MRAKSLSPQVVQSLNAECSRRWGERGKGVLLGETISDQGGQLRAPGPPGPAFLKGLWAVHLGSLVKPWWWREGSHRPHPYSHGAHHPDGIIDPQQQANSFIHYCMVWEDGVKEIIKEASERKWHLSYHLRQLYSKALKDLRQPPCRRRPGLGEQGNKGPRTWRDVGQEEASTSNRAGKVGAMPGAHTHRDVHENVLIAVLKIKT